MPGIITLTSDLGNKSQYAAILQGVIYSLAPEIKLVTISQNIANFDIMSAAFCVKNTYAYFPKGSVHLIAVDPTETGIATGIMMEYDGHIFVAPDNGICSLIAESEEKRYFSISQEDLYLVMPKSFRAAKILAPVAAALAKGVAPEILGVPCLPKELYWGEPSYDGKALRGKILHVDVFGNVITNIRKELFLEIKGGRKFEIFLRNIHLRRIVNTYADAEKGDPLAIFNTNGYLEIAMREVNAAELLGLKMLDMITIEFFEV